MCLQLCPPRRSAPLFPVTSVSIPPLLDLFPGPPECSRLTSGCKGGVTVSSLAEGGELTLCSWAAGAPSAWCWLCGRPTRDVPSRIWSLLAEGQKVFWKGATASPCSQGCLWTSSLGAGRARLSLGAHPAGRWAARGLITHRRDSGPAASPTGPRVALPACPLEWVQRTIVTTAPDLGQDHCRNADGGFLQMLMRGLGAGRSVARRWLNTEQPETMRPFSLLGVIKSSAMSAEC